MLEKKWNKGLDNDSDAYKFACSASKITCSLAGPGTGKTFSLMRKVAYLLEVKKIPPQKILLLTFSRAGASDIRKELSKLGIEGSEKINAKTLHSFCLRLLLQQSVLEHLDRFPRPMLVHEKKIMLYDIDLDHSFGRINEKEDLLLDYESAWARLQFDEPGFTQSQKDETFQERVIDWMKFHDSMTIGEIIPITLKFLDNNPMFNNFGGYSYILVDEYQDLNKAEQVIIDKFAENQKLSVVGDDNQSIYSFKNAHPEGIREFNLTHAPCENLSMKECRRCPTKVVEIANDLIMKDPENRKTKEPILIPYDMNTEGIVDILQWSSYEMEIIGIADIVKIILNQNKDVLQPEDVLILDPSKKIAKKINERLISYGIPSQFVSRRIDALLNDDDAKDIYAFIRILANKNDYVSLRYLLHKKTNWYNKRYMQIVGYAEGHDLSITETLTGIVTGNIVIPRVSTSTPIIDRYKYWTSKRDFFESLDQIEEIRDEIFKLRTDDNASLLFDEINKLINTFVPDNESETPISIQLARYFIKNIFDVISAEEDFIQDGKVRVMTLHSAKGLSGKLVLVCSSVEGLIPRLQEDSDIHEQRRLFYVGITRCKYTESGYEGRLIISSFTNLSEVKKKYLGIDVDYRGVQASRFLYDIDNNLLPRAINGMDLIEQLKNLEG
jgi:superfamily I DNA/RNA helicase